MMLVIYYVFFVSPAILDLGMRNADLVNTEYRGLLARHPTIRV